MPKLPDELTLPTPVTVTSPPPLASALMPMPAALTLPVRSTVTLPLLFAPVTWASMPMPVAFTLPDPLTVMLPLVPAALFVCVALMPLTAVHCVDAGDGAAAGDGDISGAICRGPDAALEASADRAGPVDQDIGRVPHIVDGGEDAEAANPRDRKSVV